ncbi:hypothetical protein MD484_g5297, partial [Candolleomyces efflorescens]
MKRTRESLAETLENLPDGWESYTNALRDLDADQRAVAIAHLCQELGVTENQVKKSRISLQTLPSSSSARLERFAPPMCLLPPSMHKAMFKEGWRMMDVYQERTEQDREAARLKLLEPWLVPVIGLFEGRVIDLPDAPMVASKYSSGGAVAHEVIVVGNAMFLVIEMKPNVERKDDLAQLFLELLSAAEGNKRNSYGLRVYGLLTDLISFYLYSYDPVQNAFFKDDKLIANITREFFCSDMIHVANKIFSILMYGYIECLEATVALSKARSEKQDKKPARPSLTAWESGLVLAKEAQEMFSKGVSTGSIEALEETATSALEILTGRQVVRCLCEYPDFNIP